MSHEMEILADGTAAMAYRASNGRPWHVMGNPVGDEETPRGIMEKARVDWTVSKHFTFAHVLQDDGTYASVPTGRQALLRDTDHRVLTEVGPNWEPTQNADAFDFFVDFVEAGDMQMDTAGALKNGRIVWALASLKENFTLFGGDRVNGYLLFYLPHIYGKCIEVRFVAERVVCNNTLTMALAEKGKPAVKVNHRRKFDPESVKETLGIAHGNLDNFREQAEFLGSVRMTEELMKEYFTRVFGKTSDGMPNAVALNAMRVVRNQPGIEFAPDSFWQGVNCVTYMADHVLGRGAETRFESATFGVNAKKKLMAIDLAMEMAKKAA